MPVFSEQSNLCVPMGPSPSATTAMLYLSDASFSASDTAQKSFDGRCPGGAFPVASFSYSIVQKGSESGGRPRSVESIEHGDFTVTRIADHRSPKLFRFVSRATYFTRASVFVFAEYPGQTEPYLIFSMSYVHVSSYKVNLASTSGVPIETISLKYGQMQMVGRGQDLPFNTITMKEGDVNESFSQVMNAPGNIFAGLGTAGGDSWIPSSLKSGQ